MCYAIPGKVKKVKNNTVLVDYFGQEKQAVNELGNLCVGDYIYAQGGYVIEKIPESEAKSILSVWKETFFELQDLDLRLSHIDFEKKGIDKKLQLILDKALENIPLKNEELLYLLNLNEPEACNLFFKTANFLRQKYHKNSCCVHGIIEISNYCRHYCAYCGISSHNKSISRYRMSGDEIIEVSIEAVEKYGFKALVLQSGEDSFYDAAKLSNIIKKIKEKVSVLICISFGEVGLDGLDKLYRAGARALLMRFETSNPKIYEKLHPEQDLETRLAHLKKAHDLGYLIMTGALIGLPEQTHQDIINDIHLAKELHADMYSFGPYLAHPDTPLASHEAPKAQEILKTLALIRLIDAQKSRILVTSALETLDLSAREKALLTGANSVMLNITPIKYRKQYSIYPNRVYNNESIDNQIKETINLLKSLGRAPTDLGV